MNYPYSQPLTWHAKAFGEAGRGALVVCLCRKDSSTVWWWKYVRRASEIWYLPKRIRFVDEPKVADFANVLVVYEPYCDGSPTIHWWPPNTNEAVANTDDTYG